MCVVLQNSKISEFFYTICFKTLAVIMNSFIN